jgi:hypothetical protein
MLSHPNSRIVNGVQLEFNDDSAGARKYISGDEIELPESIPSLLSETHFAVVNIFTFCFAKSPIRSITIPKTVLWIHDHAFSDCHLLANVNFSADSQLLNICTEAFANTALRTFDIPSSVGDLERFIFRCCKSLETVNFGRTFGLGCLEKAFSVNQGSDS